jgi:phenylacetate-CoA ligase
MAKPQSREAGAESATPADERQFAALALQLDYLERKSPFYAEKLRAAGVAPGFRPRNAEELAGLPFTNKQEVRHSLAAAPPFGLHAAADPGDFVQVQSTSGTTGSPSYFGLTPSDRDSWSEMGARCLAAAGFRAGDLVVHSWGMGKGFAGGVPVVQMIQHLGACVVPVGAEAGAARLLTVLNDLSARTLVGTPSYVRYLGEQAPSVLGCTAAELGVRAMVVGAEPGGGIPTVRAYLQELWNATSSEVLGNSDIAPLIWGECEDRSGMHFFGHGHVLPEIVDPATGDALTVEDGTTGELVYSALTRQAAPLLRFRSGDRVEITGTECRCGRASYKLRCTGRIDDMLIVRGVNVWPSAVQDVVMGFRPDTTGAMQIVVDFEGHSTSRNLRIQVERSAAVDAAEAGPLAERLATDVRSQLAFTPAIELVDPGTLESPGAAKASLVRRVVD